jgi:hypothetical protein
MCQFHKPVDEKRMVVILPPDSYDHWLKATHCSRAWSSCGSTRQSGYLLDAESPAQRSLLA